MYNAVVLQMISRPQQIHQLTIKKFMVLKHEKGGETCFFALWHMQILQCFTASA